MTESQRDIWYEWLLHRRFGNDPERAKAMMDFLYPVRDKILENARLAEDEILLDVGCGDGLIAFGALERVKSSRVIFSDISQNLLSHAQTAAEAMEVQARCEFVCAAAEDLSCIPSASVDVVTTRSVLIYVSAKQQAFHEFFRVLKPGGRLSIWEPINRFGSPEPPHQLWGYDVTPVMDLAQRILTVYRQIQPLDSDPMLDFDERDLLKYAESAGFAAIQLDLQASVLAGKEPMRWETFTQFAGNPRIPTVAEAMDQSLTPDEAEAFTAHLRPLVETGKGRTTSASVYLVAFRGS